MYKYFNESVLYLGINRLIRHRVDSIINTDFTVPFMFDSGRHRSTDGLRFHSPVFARAGGGSRVLPAARDERSPWRG